jgi:hypothetical protein
LLITRTTCRIRPDSPQFSRHGHPGPREHPRHTRPARQIPGNPARPATRRHPERQSRNVTDPGTQLVTHRHIYFAGTLPQGPVPVSGVFPAGAILQLLETRLQAITLSPYRADLPARHPIRLGVSCRFPGMLFSHASFRIPVSHQIQRHLLSSLPATRAIQQCTSWRTDYYEASVAIGLASRRRSHVRPGRTAA